MHGRPLAIIAVTTTSRLISLSLGTILTVHSDVLVLRVGCHVKPSFPALVQVRLVSLHEAVHADPHHVPPTHALSSTLAILDPAQRCKVGRLGYVESGVEARMVAVRKCYDKIAGFLPYFVVWHSVVPEQTW